MRRIAAVVTLVALAAVRPAASASGQNEKTLAASGGILISLVDPGRVTCIGGEPTGSWPLCSPGTQRVVWRDFTGLLSLQEVTGAAAPYLVPALFIPSNCNLDAVYRGPCWGTFHGTAEGVGTWEGTWTGTLDFTTFSARISLVGTGSGGIVEGLHLRIEGAYAGQGDPDALVPFTAKVFQIKQ